MELLLPIYSFFEIQSTESQVLHSLWQIEYTGITEENTVKKF